MAAKKLAVLNRDGTSNWAIDFCFTKFRGVNMGTYPILTIVRTFAGDP